MAISSELAPRLLGARRWGRTNVENADARAVGVNAIAAKFEALGVSFGLAATKLDDAIGKVGRARIRDDAPPMKSTVARLRLHQSARQQDRPAHIGALSALRPLSRSTAKIDLLQMPNDREVLQMSVNHDDDLLSDIATAMIEGGASERDAAKALGVDRSTIRRDAGKLKQAGSSRPKAGSSRPDDEPPDLPDQKRRDRNAGRGNHYAEAVGQALAPGQAR